MAADMIVLFPSFNLISYFLVKCYIVYSVIYNYFLYLLMVLLLTEDVTAILYSETKIKNLNFILGSKL